MRVSNRAASALLLAPTVVWGATRRGTAVYTATTAILFEDRAEARMAARILPLLDGTRTARELRGALRDVAARDVADVLRVLRCHDALTRVRRPHPTNAAPSRRIVPQRAPVAVSGIEPWRSAIAGAMRDAGAACTTRPRLAGSTSLALGVFAANASAALHDFVTAALATGQRSLAVQISAAEMLVGPLTTPGRSPCWNCAQLRMRANLGVTHPGAAADDAADDEERLIAALVAREVVAMLGANADEPRIDRHVVAFDRHSLALSVHRVVGVPGCGLCGGPTASDASHCAPVGVGPHPDLASQAVSWFVDPRTGIINRLVLEAANSSGVDVPIVVTAIPADAPSETAADRTRMPIGWGKGVTSRAAVIGAVGEAIERYAACMPNAARIVWEKIGDLAGAVLDPRQLPLYDEAQYGRRDFPFVRFDPSVAHPWVAGAWLDTQTPVWVPAILAFLSLDIRFEHLFCQGTSNGLAAGTTRDEAALRAILELLERDAFMSSWRTRRPGRRVRLDSGLDSDLDTAVNGLEALGARVELIMLPSLCGYPTALCLGRGDGVRWPAITFGLATDPDALAAVRQAILEHGQTGPYLRRLMTSPGTAVPARAEAVTQMLDHAMYYFAPERAAAFDYLFDDAPPCSLRELPCGAERSLSACARDLAAAGIRVALVDVTSSDVATTPFQVLRAISPDLQPISFGYGLDRRSVPHIAACETRGPGQEVAPIW
jgi:ribosomal protein S12 methylthiotransferase accessory factor